MAIWGSEVPIIGNIAGFIIGVAAYAIINSFIGEAVESFIRETAREMKEMWDAFKFALAKSPGSLITPGFATPLVFRGGYRGLLRSPIDVQREFNARQAQSR